MTRGVNVTAMAGYDRRRPDMLPGEKAFTYRMCLDAPELRTERALCRTDGRTAGDRKTGRIR